MFCSCNIIFLSNTYTCGCLFFLFGKIEIIGLLLMIYIYNTPTSTFRPQKYDVTFHAELNEVIPTIMNIFTAFYRSLDSSKVKRWLTSKHCIRVASLVALQSNAQSLFQIWNF